MGWPVWAARREDWICGPTARVLAAPLLPVQPGKPGPGCDSGPVGLMFGPVAGTLPLKRSRRFKVWTS